MKLAKTIKSLCGPAHLYLVVSVLVVALLAAQNLLNGNLKEFCVGTYKCDVPNVMLVLAMKILYIIFWTVILDALCKYGLKQLAWVLVLLPFVLFAIVVGIAMVK